MTLYARLAILIAISIALAASHYKAYHFGQTQKQAQWDKATMIANEGAREIERLNRMTKEKALEQRTKEILANVAAADRARVAGDRLLNTASRAVQTARDTPSACPDVASAVSDLFAECGTEARRLGQAADGHAADVRALTAAWPK